MSFLQHFNKKRGKRVPFLDCGMSVFWVGNGRVWSMMTTCSGIWVATRGKIFALRSCRPYAGYPTIIPVALVDIMVVEYWPKPLSWVALCRSYPIIIRGTCRCGRGRGYSPPISWGCLLLHSFVYLHRKEKTISIGQNNGLHLMFVCPSGLTFTCMTA